MYISRVALVAAITLIVGCSGSFGTMDRIMSSWQGAHIDEVVSQWGYPHEERNFRGQTIYVWNKNTTMTMPSNTNTTANVVGSTVYANSTTTGGGTSHWSCQRLLAVNDAGYVTSWQWSGNNCPFAEAFQYSNWRKK